MILQKIKDFTDGITYILLQTEKTERERAHSLRLQKVAKCKKTVVALQVR